MQAPKLAEGEEHFLVRLENSDLRVFLRLLRAPGSTPGPRRPLLYVHGATFPSGLSIAHRFDGVSWRDVLCAAGFDVWGLDFLGFGHSDRYLEMNQPAEANPPLGLAADAAGQLGAAIRFILEHQGLPAINLVCHSWGSMPAGLFASRFPSQVERVVWFAPIMRREATRYLPRPDAPAWRIITVDAQWHRFVEDVPPGDSVLSRAHFSEWAEAYLDSDGESRQHHPAGVKVPSGPFAEILRAWCGELPYDPGAIEAPVCIIRGEWDGLIPDGDARSLFEALVRSPEKRDVKIGRGTHLMHLEASRLALWQESVLFLGGYPAIKPR